MKLLAIADHYIPQEVMERAFEPLGQLGVQRTVTQWTHNSLEDLQQANLRIERGGPDAEPLPESIVREITDADLVVVQFAPVGHQLLAQAQQLRAIGVLRTGLENIAADTATRRGVVIVNTPGRNARAVAECAVGLMLAEMRNLGRAHAALAAGRWDRNFPNRDAIPELHGKRVGLIGLGAVGAMVAQLVTAFGSQVLVYDPWLPAVAPPYRQVPLDELLQTSDVVSLHARLTPESRHLIGTAELAQMKPSAVLVNTARSGLVDQAALVAALQQNQIMGAALDVFDDEPLPADDPLMQLENVTLTPHLAGSTIDAFHRSATMMAEYLDRLIRGQGQVPIVNGQTWGGGEPEK